MNGYIKRTNKKKAAIRKATLELFQRHGIKKVSVSDIAKAAHVSPATIYNHFSTKENLTLDTIKVTISDAVSDFTALIESGAPFLEIIEKIALIKSQKFGSMNSEFLAELLALNPEAQIFYDDAYKNNILPSWLKLLKLGKQQSYVKDQYSQKALIIYFDIIQEGVRKCQEMFSRDPQREALVKELTQMFLYGVIKPNK